MSAALIKIRLMTVLRLTMTTIIMIINHGIDDEHGYDYFDIADV